MPPNDNPDTAAQPAGQHVFFELEMGEAETVCEELCAVRVPQSLKDAVRRLIDRGIKMELLRKGLLAMVALVFERKRQFAELIVAHYLDSLAPYQAKGLKGS